MIPFASRMVGGASAPSGAYGSHRYWRILELTNNGDASITGAAEINFHSSVGGADISGGLTSGTASLALKSGEGTGNEAWKAFDDDNITTGWAVTATTNAYIGRDFGSATVVEECEIVINDSPGVTYPRAIKTGKLQYSDDNSTWSDAFSFALYGWLTGQSRTVPEATPATGYHRFWRINASAVNAGTRFQIAEAEFRATAGGADQANSGRGFSSTSAVTDANTLTADNLAFDNSTATEMVIFATAGVVGYIFPSPVAVQQVAITGSANTTRSPKDFTIQSSDDGVTWTTEKTVTGETTWTATQQRLYSVP